MTCFHPERLARIVARSYAGSMLMCRLLFILLPVLLTACDDRHRPPPKRTAHGSAKVRSGAKNVGHKTEHAFRHVGGKLQKFFTGHNTISR